MATTRQRRLIAGPAWAACFGLMAACGGAGTNAATPSRVSTSPTAGSNSGVPPGEAVFLNAEHVPYRIELRENAAPQSLVPFLDRLSKGTDRSINMARDGSAIVLDTERFGCGEWSCLAVVKGDFTSGHAVQSDGELVHVDGPVAIGSKGNVIVYSAESSTGHSRDLFAIRKQQEGYGKPVLLSSASAHAYNRQPALSLDGLRVVFDCGPDPYQGAGTGVCMVDVDGSNFRDVVVPGRGQGVGVKAFHHPSIAPDGSIVVEMDRAPQGERIWRLSSAGDSASLLSEAYPNDNSPCVLPDGRILSLWLARSGGRGTHEIKLMSADGTQSIMVMTNEDVADIVLGCGNALPARRD